MTYTISEIFCFFEQETYDINRNPVGTEWVVFNWFTDVIR